MGLNEKEVLESRKKYGSNVINKKDKNSFFRLVIESLGDPIIKILLIALAIKILFLFKSFDWYETIGIAIAIFLASFISSISEYGSNKAFEHLQNETENYDVFVYRNNILTKIKNIDVVVGDIIKVSSGEKIPADGVIIQGKITLDESFMSGEAEEVNKSIGDKVYGGSLVYQSDAIMKVESVGKNTYMGSIAISLSEVKEDSPLKKKLRVLAKQISLLGYIGSGLASLSYLFIKIFYENNFDLNLIYMTVTNGKVMLSYFIYALTLAVTIIIMAVPEGLPMMITLVLSSNMKKMLKDNVLVRKLVGIETSGSLNLLLCDKTGTLTEGKLTVRKLVFNDLEVDNVDYLNENLKKTVINLLYLNNESEIINGNVVGGNSTDYAIKSFICKYKPSEKVISKETFSSVNKYAFVKTNNKYYIKGAAEVIIKKCKSYIDKNGCEKQIVDRDHLYNILNKYTMKGYRVIASAIGDSLDNLTFICYIILLDKIRKETKDSINIINKAGVKIMMITGDDKKTAETIAEDIGMLNSNSIVLSHEELDKMSDYEIKNKLDNICVIARALPKDKARIVNIAKEKGLIVGMTGDGVNDALALKFSDVGFAMGSGSEVSKEASDIVILDNNILSISKAILYGRSIFKNIRKFVVYQLTVNVCALLLSIIGILLGISTPITIVQMLWLNMIMDTFAGLAFSYEPALKEYMYEKPKKTDEKIINGYMLNQIVVNGLASFLICILFLKTPLLNSCVRDSKLMTAFFALFIFLGINNSFLARSSYFNIFKNLLLNKVFIIINIFIFIVQILIIYFGGDLFRAYGLNVIEFCYILLLSFLIYPIDFIRKLFLKQKNKPMNV